MPEITEVLEVLEMPAIALPSGIPAPKFRLFQRVQVHGSRIYPATLCGMTWNSEEAIWLYAIADGSRVVTEDCLVAEAE